MSKVLQGKAVYGGIAIGRIRFMGRQETVIKEEKVTDVAAQTERFEQARQKAIDSLNQLQQETAKEVGEETAQIFQAQAMLLEDMEYRESVNTIIRQQETTAEYAVAVTGEKFFQKLSGLEDAYLRERAADVKDISERVLAILAGKEKYAGNDTEETNTEPVILVAEDLTPSQTVQLDKGRILSFVTQYGSVNSHTAILARTMNIPALVGIPCTEDMDGSMAIVDGHTGKLYLEPEEETLRSYREKQAQEEKKRQRLTALKGKENVTRDGRKIAVYANIGSVADVPEVLANDAGGIGLFRSEFLYLEGNDYPSEETQFKAYQAVATGMEGKRVIIRTLDIGADKQAAYFQIPEEKNPAMGYRAIRICLDRVDMFKTQIRAIYRASASGNLAIMFPMIISVEEVRRAKEIIAQVKAELMEEGLPYQECPVGIMIETPAAVMISDLLAKEVDFFSVGTNDLSQYTLAIDRLNPKLDGIYNPYHEAILRMLRLVVENGHKEGCLVGICGELAADVTMTETLLRMGFDELSVTPSMVLPVREKIRSITLD